MLFYFSFDAILHRQRWNAPAVLLGTAVYGNWAIWHGSVKAMLAGAGFQLFVAGLAGICCALLLFRWRRLGASSFLSLLAALVFSLAWYLGWYQIILPRVAPMIPQYTTPTAAIAAHVLLGLALSRIPVYSRRIQPDDQQSVDGPSNGAPPPEVPSLPPPPPMPTADSA
jgi:hypothetical protein